MKINNDSSSRKYNPYGRSRSIIGELFDTYNCNARDRMKMSFFDFFVYRWYKNYVEPRFKIK